MINRFRSLLLPDNTVQGTSDGIHRLSRSAHSHSRIDLQRVDIRLTAQVYSMAGRQIQIQYPGQ